MGLDKTVSSNYHLGHLLFEHIKEHGDVICQIDAGTGEEETYASVLKRAIQLARALRKFGLKPGDVLAVGGQNHLDVCIPLYAALFNGLPIVGVDPYFKYEEVYALFKIARPNIAFCQKEVTEIFSKAANDLDLDLKIVAFDDKDYSMSMFVEMYDEPESDSDFKVSEFDTDKVCAFLLCNSGTMGKLKIGACKHQPFLTKVLFLNQFYKFNAGHKRFLTLSPVHWISNYLTVACATVLGTTKIQTSIPDDMEHVIDIINKYKPSSAFICTSILVKLIKRQQEVDFSCFKKVTGLGGKMHPDVLSEYKKCFPEDCILLELYGQTEMLGFVLGLNPHGPAGNCGVPLPLYDIKLVDVSTHDVIKEPGVTGELLVKGPGISEYYNDPEETGIAFTEDGYFRTGDLLYRDEDHNYFFVDRIRALIKFRNSHVHPAELEELIIRLPGVKEVCVVGISDPVDDQIPVACVVREKGHDVTAEQIKDLVKSSLSRTKELRGGVVFVENLPYTSTGKIARAQVQEMAVNSSRE